MKNELRKIYKEVRKNIIINPQEYATQLKQVISPNTNISIYYPLNYELNILLIMEYFQENQLSLPVVYGSDHPLQFHKFQQGKTQLQKQKYSYEPINKESVIPKYCIVPLLCFDPITKHRVGYGGGYYDKTIKHYRMNHYDTMFIGLGHEQLKNHVPSEPHDQKLDIVVTESKIYD